MYSNSIIVSGMSTVFIAGGTSYYYDYQYDVEVFNLMDSGSVCQAMPDFPNASLFATANTFNGKPVICGGDLVEEYCFIYNPVTYLWENFAPLLHERSNHASVQLTDDSFWILGTVLLLLCIKNIE